MAQKTDNKDFRAKVIEAIRAATQAPRGLTPELIALRDDFARKEKKSPPDWFIPAGMTPPKHPCDEPRAPSETKEEEDLAVRRHVFFGNDLAVRLSEDAKDYGKRLGDWFEKAVAWDQYQIIRRVAWRWYYADLMLAGRGEIEESANDLRDDFAKAAVKGMLANQNFAGKVSVDPLDLARLAYEQADAMLAVRGDVSAERDEIRLASQSALASNAKITESLEKIMDIFNKTYADEDGAPWSALEEISDHADSALREVLAAEVRAANTALADMAEGLLWALEHFVTVAEETRVGCAVLGSESRTGKLLRAMAGQLKGHRVDIDTIHEILERARGAVARGEQP